MIAELKRKGILWLVTVCMLSVLLTSCGSKSTKILENVQIGQKYLSEENYAEAVQAFTKAIEMGPESILAYRGRAEAYVGLNQYEDAKADYKNIIAKSGDQPLVQAEAYVNYADVCEQLGDEEEAQASYEKAYKLLNQADISAGEARDALMDKVETALAKQSETTAQENGPQEISPLPLTSVQSPLEDGTYDASFDCGSAVSGDNLSFQVYGCYYYDVNQVENLKPGDTISGQYGYFYDDAKFTMEVEEVSILEGIESRWVIGKMQDEYSDEPYDQQLYFIRDGQGYFVTMDDSADLTWSEKKDFRPIGDAVEKMSSKVVLKATPLGGTQVTASGIEAVKKIIAANRDSWWMVGSLTITVKNHQITEINYIEHNEEEDYDAGVSNLKLPSQTDSISSAAKIDLADYIGQDLNDFLAARPELKDVGATDGKEYTDGKLSVGASYNGTKIDFVQLNEKCGYSIAGIECGMSETEAVKLAEQRYGAPDREDGDYRSYTIDEAMATSLGILFQSGKVSRVSITSELNLYS